MKLSIEALKVPKSHLSYEIVIFPSSLPELEYSSHPHSLLLSSGILPPP